MITQVLHPPLRLWNGHSLGADMVTVPFDIQSWDGVGIQLVWTGTPVGLLTFQVSIDPTLGWGDLPEGTLNINGAGDALRDFNATNFYYFRISYTRTSGTGTIIAAVGAKV